MISLHISHRTTYRYRLPVVLAPHRLLLRPRESQELRLIESTLAITPDATVTWANDVFGNAVATANFDAMTDKLTILSTLDLQLDAAAYPIFSIAASAISYPFNYSDAEWTDLGALTLAAFPDADGSMKTWALTFVRSNPTDTLSLLKDLSEGIANRIQYQSRDDEGTQSPRQTLERGWGSCRDFAVLFIEAARSLGFGARVVSGYLFNPNGNATGSSGPGSTHAWAEVFVPGAGWITFDSTNHSVGGSNLIPVAVTRDIAQAVPVSGSFIGPVDAFLDMSVEVFVTQSKENPPGS